MTPGGSAAAFSACLTPGQPSTQGIYVQKLDGSPDYLMSAPLAGNPDGPSAPAAWSHDGRLIAYPVGQPGTDGRTGLTFLLARPDHHGGRAVHAARNGFRIRAAAPRPMTPGLRPRAR